jgi:hypothetical protein
MPPIEAAIGSLGTGALALLRTAAWMYGALVLVAAATAPLGPHPDVAAGCLLPLGPLVLAAVTRSLLAGRGRELRIVPFALCAFAAGVVLAVAREALAPTGAADLLAVAGAVVATGLAAEAFSDGEPGVAEWRGPRVAS